MYIIAFDLGTGGVKASLYNERFETKAKVFIEYDTYYPAPAAHEQKPADWWNSVISSTRRLIEKSGVTSGEIACVALSGHSLVTVPIDAQGALLLDQVPIWSDSTATKEAADFFRVIDQRDWYMTTGNGFPAPCYSLFKLMHLKKNDPGTFSRIYKVLGSKDYINYRLTGEMYTDPSYASGSGGYDLISGRFKADFWKAAGINVSIFPEIVPSHTIIGHITPQAAQETGLAEGTPVACGGVDNACMALGAVGDGDGRCYLSLGSSSWTPINSPKPILDADKKPYVFAHIAEGMFTSAFSIFAGGSSLKWVRDTICSEIADRDDAYALMDKMAATSPVGSNGILFNPSLAGGTSQNRTIHIRGAYLGLHLGASKADLIRSAMEGITLNLKTSYDFMKQRVNASDSLLLCGGGSKSAFWLQMFADIFGIEIIKTNIDQDAASVGAAAIAARAVGLWDNYHNIDQLHKVEIRCAPDAEVAARYQAFAAQFNHITEVLEDLGDYLTPASQ
ncbi:MAG: pentose kinase [Clostridiales Family XIII bacterium]|jgi:xylulokinase|nr:pentose kinase [Clostridiales Family XIII bacterium]